jgi:tetratricopeptide (TPR) repeat protein
LPFFSTSSIFTPRNETNPVHCLSVCKLPADGGVQFAPCGEGMDRAGREPEGLAARQCAGGVAEGETARIAGRPLAGALVHGLRRCGGQNLCRSALFVAIGTGCEMGETPWQPFGEGTPRTFYGRSLAAENQNDEATKVYLSTLDQAIKDKEYDQAGYIDSYLGDLYNDKEEYEKARLKYEESSKYFKLANNLGSYSNSLKDVGKMYAFSDSFQQALSMIQKAKEVAENLNDSARIPSMYNGLANIYSMMNEDSVAERYIRQSVAMERTDKAPDYSALAEIQLKMGRDAEAEKSLEEATKYVGDNPYTQISIASEYYNLAKIRGNYKQALEYKERRDQIVDSIRRIQNKSHILEVEKRYDHQQILSDAMRLRVTSQRYFSAMLLFLFLCLLIGFIHIIRVRKKERKIHEQQQQLLEDENHLLHLSEDLRQKEEELQKLREENSDQGVR